MGGTIILSHIHLKKKNATNGTARLYRETAGNCRVSFQGVIIHFKLDPRSDSSTTQAQWADDSGWIKWIMLFLDKFQLTYWDILVHFISKTGQWVRDLPVSTCASSTFLTNLLQHFKRVVIFGRKSPSHPTRPRFPVHRVWPFLHSGAGPDVLFVEGWVSWRCWLSSVSRNYLASSLEEMPGFEQAEPCWTGWLMVGKSLVSLGTKHHGRGSDSKLLWAPCYSFRL